MIAVVGFSNSTPEYVLKGDELFILKRYPWLQVCNRAIHNGQYMKSIQFHSSDE